jgi:hypothetical protein
VEQTANYVYHYVLEIYKNKMSSLSKQFIFDLKQREWNPLTQFYTRRIQPNVAIFSENLQNMCLKGHSNKIVFEMRLQISRISKLRFANPFFRLKIGCFQATVLLLPV